MDVKHCSGCYDNFYNHAVPGGCWSREEAQLVKRWRIHRDAPMDRRSNFERVTVPNCYSDNGTPKQYYYLDRLPEHLGGDKP